MKFGVCATDAARRDAAEAAGWYETQRPGFGAEFRAEVAIAAKNLAETALHHSVRFADVRRAGLRRFSSYGLFYIVRGDEVKIFALVHSARHPAWVRRRRSDLG